MRKSNSSSGTWAEIYGSLGDVTKGEPGKSAYEIAVDHGFEGTEEEWLSYVQANAERAVSAEMSAVAAKEAAQYASDEAQGFAESASTSAGVAHTEAESAAVSAARAEAAAVSAGESRDGAAMSAVDAADSATAAGASATEAASQALLATGRADEARQSQIDAHVSEVHCEEMWLAFKRSPDLAKQYAEEAAQSATAAAGSATASANSATASADSAAESASSAEDSAGSASEAADSATAATASAQAAAASAQEATTQAQAAEASATASANSANASATSVSEAAESASNAAQSERNIAGAEEATAASAASAASAAEGAATSASAAATSATDAADSADSASASATSAANSASDAAASATAAANSASEAHDEVENVLNSIDAAVDRELDIILPQQLAGKLDVNGKAVDSAHADNADTVSNHTVQSDVPANAVFTDTTYDAMTAAEATAGTGTTARVITAKVLADKIAEAIASLVNSSPATLDTLSELATALGNDPNFATTIATALGNKLDKSGGTVTGNMSVTGTITASGSVTGKTINVTAENAADEGGQVNLLASKNTYNGISIDNLKGLFRVFGIPSADGTTKTGYGTPLEIDPYAKTIKGGYTFTGNVTGNVSGSSGSCTGNAATATSAAACTGNSATATKAGQLTTARTIDGVSFNGTANITHYGSCSTAAATAAKTVACTGFTLATGARIEVKFTVTNTAANPTLNVNSTGAKAIYYRGAAISAGYLAANRTYSFVYNGTQYELVGDLDTNSNNATAQNISTANATYPILLGHTANATANIGNQAALFGSGVKVNPSTSAVIATTFQGALSGNAATATKINGKTIPVVSSFDSSTGTLALTSLS